MAGDDVTNNGRVTMALLGQRLDQNTAILKELKDYLKSYVECEDLRVRAVEIKQATNIEQIKNQGSDIDKLNTRSNILDGINGIMAFVAGIVGFIYGGKQ